MLLKITVIVVDDERPAREEMRYLLETYTDVEVIGTAGNANDAVTMISSLRPTIVFLDISMPGTNGIELLKTLSPSQFVVFVTAHDEFAINAFEHGASDYLLKPVTPERLEKCLARIKARITAVKNSPHPLYIKEKDSFHLASYDDIKFIESYGNYVKVYFTDNVRVLSMTLSSILTALDDSRFIRINRKHIVNVDNVKSFTEKNGRQIALCLKDDFVLICSSRRAPAIRSLFRNNNSAQKFLQ